MGLKKKEKKAYWHREKYKKVYSGLNFDWLKKFFFLFIGPILHIVWFGENYHENSSCKSNTSENHGIRKHKHSLMAHAFHLHNIGLP